jgi:hypothetical protein
MLVLSNNKDSCFPILFIMHHIFQLLNVQIKKRADKALHNTVFFCT